MYVPTFPGALSSDGASLSAVWPQPGLPPQWTSDRPCSRFSSILLDLADPRPDSRVVLFGPGTLELCCELIRHGSDDVRIVGFASLPHDSRADIAIVPRADTARQIGASIAAARRLLTAPGALVMGDVPHGLLDLATECLQSHGFGLPRSWTGLRGLVLQARLPADRDLPCA